MQESYVNNPCLFVIFYFINFITEAFSLKQIKIYLIKQEFAIYVLIDTFVTMLCIKHTLDTKDGCIIQAASA